MDVWINFLLNKISHRFLVTTKLFTVPNINIYKLNMSMRHQVIFEELHNLWCHLIKKFTAFHHYIQILRQTVYDDIMSLHVKIFYMSFSEQTGAFRIKLITIVINTKALQSSMFITVIHFLYSLLFEGNSAHKF